MGDNLKSFRQVNNLTQQELADYLGDGMSKAFLSQIEHGTRNLPVAHLAKLLNNPYGWDTSMIQEDAKHSSMFVGFLSANNIDIVELAKYLGLSKPYMSQIVSGAAKLADSRFQMLLDNPYGWDTSMLSREMKSEPTQRATQPAAIRIDTEAELQHALEKIDLYKEMLDDLRKQIDFLQKMLERTSSTG